MNFNQSYDRNSFILFLRTQLLPGDFKATPGTLGITCTAKTTLLSSATILGQSPSLKLAVLELTHTGKNDPRVGLSRETFRLMKQHNIANALAAYRTDDGDSWRLSLVTSDLQYDEANDRVLFEFSNPRRFSFLLGPESRTATARKKLAESGVVSSFDDLLSRFSLEVVNREFYREIATLFTELCGGQRQNGKTVVEYAGSLVLPTSDQRIKQEFAVRLIGRIVFCWFLKQKNLIPSHWLSSAGVSGTPKYYHKHIEPLFFEILNRKQNLRRPEFQNDESNTIPFLNGGLFAPHRNDFYETDSDTGFNHFVNQVKLPDEWLSRLFVILETYNFTIDENTTVDVDLSIDPEMLGRIFENLLAEINPETGESARKKTGSFYTPRAIVDYMVTESLVRYLALRLNAPGGNDTEARLRTLFDYEKDASESARFDVSEINAIIRAFHDMKCIDPACGSGAYPMGILQKTLLALEKLDPDGERFLSLQLEGITDDYIRSCTEEMLRAKGYQYIHKLSLVQGCIYGIDIQPIAVEMSRLRAFLSLIVDERVSAAENRGIRPLPNLEFKFLCANSLVHLPAHGDNLLLAANEQHLVELRHLRTRYLNATGDSKQKIKAEFQGIQRILFDQLIGWTSTRQKADSYATALSAWDPFGDDKCEWFDPGWMFGIGDGDSGGFDIVIGNPPYIQLQKIKDVSKELEKEKYSTFEKTGDIYALFYERGAQLLKADGVLCYITSNKWMRANYGESLRSYFLSAGRFVELIDFGDSPIFENATTYTNIALWQKGSRPESSVRAWDLSRAYTNSDNLPAMLKASEPGLPLFGADSFVIANPAEAALKKRIESVGVPLGDKSWGISINYGIKTGLNEAFIIDKHKYDELVAADPKSAEILKPVLRGRDIKRYRADWAGLYLVATHNGYVDANGVAVPAVNVEKDYPAVFEYLKSVGDAIDRGEITVKGSGLYKRSDQGWHWSNLRDCAYWEEFGKPKVIFGRFMERATYTYDDTGCMHNDALYFAAPATPYLAAVLNSSVTWFYLRQLCTDLANGFLQALLQYQVQLPIPQISAEEQRPFEQLVGMIQLCRSSALDSEGDFLEQVVDLMVYALYFDSEARVESLYITDAVASILGTGPVPVHAIPSVVGKLRGNSAIAAAVEHGVRV